MIRTVYIQPFGTSLMIATSERDLHTALGRFGHPPDRTAHRAYGAVYTLETDEGAAQLLMFLPAERNEWVLWHEALHAAVSTMDLNCVPVCADNDEIMAYLQGHIVQLVDEACYTPRRPKRKREVE